MQNIVIEHLLSSVTNLEQAIEKAKIKIAANSGASPDLVPRLESYQEICDTQRQYSSSLEKYLKEGNYEEVARLIKLINGLSTMILDDVKVVLGSLQSDQPQKTEKSFN